MAVMMPREKWTDERLDELNKKVDDLKTEMREGFAGVDKDIRELRGDVKELNGRFDGINERLDAQNRNLFVVAGAIIAALIGVNVF